MSQLPRHTAFTALLALCACFATSAMAADAPAPEAKPAADAPAAQAEPAVAAPSAETPAVPAASATPAKAPKAAKSPAAKTAKAPAAKNPAGVVITVGPSKIRKRQIDTLVDLMVKVKKSNGAMQPGEKEYLERMIATNLIGQELLDLEAKRLNVVADEKSLDSLNKVFRGNFPSDEAFKKALRDAGDNEQGLREKMARQIKADKLLNTQMTPVSRPTDKEMQEFFTAHKAAFPFNDSLRACQVLFMVEKTAGAAETMKKKTDLEKLRAELLKDTAQIDVLLTRFVMAARNVSDGPEKKDGGDLQRFLPSDFNPEFKKQVTALKVGQLSPVFRTPLGWHLVILTERNDGKFESYKLQIARALVQEKAAKAGKNLKKYLQTLAERYKVSYMDKGYRDTSLAGVYEH